VTVATGGSAPLDARLLGIYLNDHLAGATAGVALARRSRAGARSRDLAAALDVVMPEIAEDRATLLEHMRRLGVPVRTYKVVAGRAAELVGRFKPNGRIRERSPLTDLVELDGLVMGIGSKESLWRNLRGLADELAGPTAAELDVLIARAENQRATLERVRPMVLREAFVAPLTGEGSPA
jgi:hypothetical protein